MATTLEELNACLEELNTRVRALEGTSQGVAVELHGLRGMRVELGILRKNFSEYQEDHRDRVHKEIETWAQETVGPELRKLQSQIDAVINGCSTLRIELDDL